VLEGEEAAACGPGEKEVVRGGLRDGCEAGDDVRVVEGASSK